MRKSRFMQEYSGDLGEWWQNHAMQEVARAKELFETNANVKNGVVSWKSNGSVIMDDMAEMMEVAGCKFDRAATKVARDVQAAIEIAAYKESMKNHKPSAEEIYEMRAAFGTGTKVVDIFTGEEIQL